MYYNSDKSNSEYYNTYKQEMEELEDFSDSYSLEKIIKIGLTLLVLGGVTILIIYAMNYVSTNSKQISLYSKQNNTFVNIDKELQREPIIFQNTLPKSIQIQEKGTNNRANANVSKKDISLIVKIILAQMNHKTKLLLEEQINLAEKSTQKRESLKESNHYNKIILSNKTLSQRDNKQTQIRKKLNSIIANTQNTSSNYEISIRKELFFRSNEMRIIIVQEGDTLSKIAKKAYGNRDDYSKIFTANPEVLKNPNEIFVGQRLRIPA